MPKIKFAGETFLWLCFRFNTFSSCLLAVSLLHLMGRQESSCKQSAVQVLQAGSGRRATAVVWCYAQWNSSLKHCHPSYSPHQPAATSVVLVQLPLQTRVSSWCSRKPTWQKYTFRWLFLKYACAFGGLCIVCGFSFLSQAMWFFWGKKISQFRCLSWDGWLHGHGCGLVLEDSFRTGLTIWCTPVVSHVSCMLGLFEKNAHRMNELSLGSGRESDKGTASGTAVCSLPRPTLALLAQGLHSHLYQFLFHSVFWQWRVIYKCSCFTITLSHLQAELLLTGMVPAALSSRCCHLPAAATWFIVPYDWPGEFSCFGVDGLVFSLFSLLVCFPVQPRERLCHRREQDEGGKDAGEGQGCLF